MAPVPLGGRRRVLGVLRANPGLARLIIVRYGAQWGDGLFQAALGGAVLFNPERAADPAAVAAGLAVLLLPYSLLGPFAGALLDRWDRRRVLLWANLLRAAFIGVVAVALAGGVAGTGLFLGALAVTGVSRFVLSGLSAALPHVVAPRAIVGVNAALATSGALVAVAGAVSALGVRAIVGSGDGGSAVAVAVAAVGSVIAATAAAGYVPRVLGPDASSRSEHGTTGRAVAAGWWRGARAAARAPGVAAALSALGAHRVAFGINTLLALLLFRYSFTGQDALLPGGIVGVGQVVVAGALGLGVAAVLTPVAVAYAGTRRTVTTAVAVACVTQLVLVPTLAQGPLLAAAFVLGTAGQVVKLSADAAMQLQVDDAHRGQVFALQDAVFNVGYVGAVAVAALVVAPDGRSVYLAVAAAGVYALGLVAHLVLSRASPEKSVVRRP